MSQDKGEEEEEGEKKIDEKVLAYFVEITWSLSFFLFMGAGMWGMPLTFKRIATEKDI